jgi:thioredoxin:protein disulfide reductase
MDHKMKMKMKSLLATIISFLTVLLVLGLILSAGQNIFRDISHAGLEPQAYAEASSMNAGPKTGGIAFERVAGGEATGDAAPSADQGDSEASLLWALLGVFLGGMALNLTPCVYPLIPVTVSYFGGQAFAGKEGRGSGIILHGVLYVIGLAVMNSFLGVFAALSGRMLGAVLQNPITLIVVAAVLVAFALSMFGFWEFRLPGFITRAASRNFAGYFGSFFIGTTLGLVAAPCLGPFVVSLLVWIASTGNPWFGFIFFFSLSLGMGLPLFVLALLSGRLSSLPKSGEWMLWVRKLMGWVLIGMAAWFVKPVLPEIPGLVVVSLIALAAGIHLGWIEQSTAAFRAFGWVKKAAGILGIGIAVMLFLGGAVQTEGIKWRAYNDQTLAEAKSSGKPIIIDFYADWCGPCQLMNKHTFHNRSVVDIAEKDFVTLNVDLTRGGDPQKERLVRRYNIQGVPTILFLDPGGEEKEDLRVMEFMPPDRFLARMNAVKKLIAGAK